MSRSSAWGNMGTAIADVLTAGGSWSITLGTLTRLDR